jgi:hypothetical protein
VGQRLAQRRRHRADAGEPGADRGDAERRRYDAVYLTGGGIRPEYEQRSETHDRPAEHFVRTFPQLADLRFTIGGPA